MYLFFLLPEYSIEHDYYCIGHFVCVTGQRVFTQMSLAFDSAMSDHSNINQSEACHTTQRQATLRYPP